MKNLKDILNKLSNGKIDILLKNYFLSKDGHKILNKIGYESNAILNELLINLKDLYFNIDKKEKYKVLSVVSSIYSREQLWKLGFRFSLFIYTKVKKLKSLSSTILISKSKIKRQIKQEELDKEFEVYLNDHSEDAVNRTICLKRKEYPEDDENRDKNNQYKKLVSLFILYIIYKARNNVLESAMKSVLERKYTFEMYWKTHWKARKCTCEMHLRNTLAKYTGKMHWQNT